MNQFVSVSCLNFSSGWAPPQWPRSPSTVSSRCPPGPLCSSNTGCGVSSTTISAPAVPLSRRGWLPLVTQVWERHSLNTQLIPTGPPLWVFSISFIPIWYLLVHYFMHSTHIHWSLPTPARLGMCLISLKNTVLPWITLKPMRQGLWP